MTRLRPRYRRYLFFWCAVWLPVTVLTQMPECYERSLSLAQWEHSAPMRELLSFAGSRLLLEVPFALLWGSFSWLLTWGTLALLRRFQWRSGSPTLDLSARRTVVGVIALMAAVEAIALGVPLARLNTYTANFSLAIEDTPAVTITDRSVGIESDGVLLAFPLACLAAGLTATRQQNADGPQS